MFKIEFPAPVGCLQYFEETGGEIRSFNYRTEVDGTGTNQVFFKKNL